MKRTLRARLDLQFGRLRTALYLMLTNPHRARRLRELSRAPIVIGGCNRSGTSLMLSLLSCHPDVLAIRKETHGLCQRLLLHWWQPNPPVRMWRVYRELAQLEVPDEVRRWCEKTPRNARNYNEIVDYFGSAVRILNVVRDGRDVITSFYGDDDEPMVEPEYWRDYVALGKAMESHPQVMTVRYEDLVQNPKATLQRVCEHLELEYVSAFEDYPASARLRKHGGFGQARPVSASSIGRWKKPEFSERVAQLLADPVSRELLVHYRYLPAEAVGSPNGSKP